MAVDGLLPSGPVDRDQGGVENRVGKPADATHRRVQVLGVRREQGLSAGVEAPSPTFAPGAFGAPVGQVVQGAAGRRAAPADLIHRPDGRPMIRAASGMLLGGSGVDRAPHRPFPAWRRTT